MPVFNGLPYLQRAVTSVVEQNCSSWQLLISDNGSHDGTRDYLGALEKKGDQRIKIYFQEQNLGIYGNLNFLIDRVKSDIIHILCADDYLKESYALDLILRYWQSASTDILGVRWNGRNLFSIGLPGHIAPQKSQLYFFLFGNIMGSLSCVSFRKKGMQAVGGFDQAYPYAGDFEGWIRMASHGAVVIPDCEDIVVIREHPGQASSYLNLNGELHSQLSAISSLLYVAINARSYVYRLFLRVAGTIIYDSQVRMTALRAAFSGKPKPLFTLNQATRSSTYTLPLFWVNVLFVSTLGGRLAKKAIISACIKLSK